MCDTSLTAAGVADLADCGKGAVWHAVRKGELSTIRDNRPLLICRCDAVEGAKPDPPIATADELRDLYWQQGMTLAEIADKLGCGTMTVQRQMVEYDIERRDPYRWSEGHDWRDDATPEQVEQWHQRMSEAAQGRNPWDYFSPQEYEARRQAISEQNRRLWDEGVFGSDEWYEKQRKSHAGEKCWRWKGGLSNYRGPNWQQKRLEARARDNFACQKCGATETELRQELDVHHIVRFELFDDYKEANQLDNLISYCRPCHLVVEHETNC